ncbi:MAG: transglutaminase, partial [Leeuwenhoekiella sp.]
NLINELKIDQIENLEVKNIDVLNEPVVEKYNFELENAYDQVGNSIYLSPLLFIRMGENPFKLKERQFPINFTHPFTLTRIINLKFPEEYQIESLPEPVNFALPEEMGSFVYKIAQNKNSLNLIIEFNINKPVIPVAYHSALQDLYNSRVVKENEKVVLTKIQ